MALVYINGDYCDKDKATISIFDRGVLFADSIYEVIPVYNGHARFVERHLKRLSSSLKNARINNPAVDWLLVFKELIKQNGGGNLQIYVQVTRGNNGMRKHDIPKTIKPSVFAFTLHNPYPSDESKRLGLHAHIVEDLRWLRCDIKTTAMLANVLLNDDALCAGANTALLSRNGLLTEGSASNVFIVNDNNIIQTPPLDNYCLPGITRQLAIELIKELKLPLQEEPIPIQNIFSAREIWITSTTKEIYPVTRVNQHQVGQGSRWMNWEQLNEKFKQLINSYD